jgi:hypothetical protein
MSRQRRIRRRTADVRPTDPVVNQLIEKAAAKGLTPFALSRAIGAHPSVLNRWRNGTSPRLSALRPYFDYLDSVQA